MKYKSHKELSKAIEEAKKDPEFIKAVKTFIKESMTVRKL